HRARAARLAKDPVRSRVCAPPRPTHGTARGSARAPACSRRGLARYRSPRPPRPRMILPGVAPYLSIVLPPDNEARRLSATLTGWRSFLAAQTFEAEVLVVDDGSADATAEVASAGGARVLRLARNQGKGGAVRAGVLTVAGEVIAYADADMNVA